MWTTLEYCKFGNHMDFKSEEPLRKNNKPSDRNIAFEELFISYNVM